MDYLKPIVRTDTDAQVAEAISIATYWESTLGEGYKGRALKAFEALREGKFEIKDPQSYTRCINVQPFSALKQLHPSASPDLLDNCDGYKVYVVSVPILLFPGRRAQYRSIGCNCTFRSTGRGQHQPAVHSIFPEAVWKPVLAWGGSMELAADSSLHFGVEIPQPPAELERLLPKLGVNLKGRVASQGELKSFVKLLPFQHNLGRMEIIAQGVGNSALWYLKSKAAIRAQKHTYFVSVLKIPTSVNRITVEVAAEAEVAYDWLMPQIQHLWEKLKHIFERPKALALQDFKQWPLDVPTC